MDYTKTEARKKPGIKRRGWKTGSVKKKGKRKKMQSHLLLWRQVKEGNTIASEQDEFVLGGHAWGLGTSTRVRVKGKVGPQAATVHGAMGGSEDQVGISPEKTTLEKKAEVVFAETKRVSVKG